MVNKGDKVICVVLSTDQVRKRISLALKQTQSDPWPRVPGRYRPGDIKKGKVTRVADFGAFVALEPGLEGLIHISELADYRISHPIDVVKVGDEVAVKILRVDVADSSQRRWGFELTARTSGNARAGTLTSTDNTTQVECDTRTCSTTSVQFITHTLSGTRNGTSGGVSFEFDWTPPSSDVGAVTLYAAGNAGYLDLRRRT